MRKLAGSIAISIAVLAIAVAARAQTALPAANDSLRQRRLAVMIHTSARPMLARRATKSGSGIRHAYIRTLDGPVPRRRPVCNHR